MMKNTAICVQSHEMRISPGPRNGHPVAVTFGQSNFKHSIGPLRQASGYVPNALIRFSQSAEEGMLAGGCTCEGRREGSSCLQAAPTCEHPLLSVTLFPDHKVPCQNKMARLLRDTRAQHRWWNLGALPRNRALSQAELTQAFGSWPTARAIVESHAGCSPGG